MSVSTFEITTAYTHQLGMTKLHELLIAEGWEIVAADSDAIGTGTLSDPAWDKAFVTNQDAGIVVYRMSATPMTTQWYVRLRARFGAVANTFNFTTQLGTGHSGTELSGVVSTELGFNAGSANNSGNTYLSVTPSGFCMVGNISGRMIPLCVELARNQDATLSNDIIKHCQSPVGGFGALGYGIVPVQGHPSVRLDTIMEYPARAAMYIASHNGPITVNFHSLSDGVSAELPCGPMFFNKRYSGFSNMALHLPEGRFDPGDVLEMVVGSETLTFLALSYAPVLGQATRQTRLAIRIG
jgi:hypothetical protein